MIIADLERTYYAQVASGAKWEGTSDPLGDAVHRFEERIGLRDNPEDIALAMHKQMLAARGIEWDDTPVGAGSGQWWDQDVEFTEMSDLDAQARKRDAGSTSRGLFAKGK
jgi:hypothetical protein